MVQCLLTCYLIFNLLHSLSVSEVLNFVVLDIDEMGQTQLNEVSAHLILADELGELLMQRDGALLSERLLPIVLHDLEARLKDIRPVNSFHVFLERVLIANLINHLPVLCGIVRVRILLTRLRRLVIVDAVGI